MSNPITKSISVIIPTLNAEKYLPDILSALETQSYPASEIIIVDSASSDKTVSICESNQNVKLIQIKREDFDHGKTRDMAFRESSGDIVIFMTQDAIPANEEFICNLIKPLSGKKIAVSCGRQIPKKSASKKEKLIRKYNYPAESHQYGIENLTQKGIKSFFCSNVCAAYKREVYFELNGFEYPLKTNEDMLFAAKAINAGYQIAYAADALVYHSHNLSLAEQFQRNFNQGYEIERHKEMLKGISANPEGLNFVKYVSFELIKQGSFISFFSFMLDCMARFLGNKSGKSALLRTNEQQLRS